MSPSENLTNWLDDVRAKSKAAAEEIASAATNTGELGESFVNASDDATKLITKLHDQIATFGLSSTEAEIFRLSQEGVSGELLEQIRALDGQLHALEDSKAKQDELSSATQTVIEGLKTPLDKYKEEVASLTELLDTGNLTQEKFDKALAKATGAFGDQADITLSSPELLAKGSQAESTFLSNWQNGVNAQDVQAQKQDETNSILKDILRALGLSENVEEVVAIA